MGLILEFGAVEDDAVAAAVATADDLALFGDELAAADGAERVYGGVLCVLRRGGVGVWRVSVGHLAHGDF